MAKDREREILNAAEIRKEKKERVKAITLMVRERLDKVMIKVCPTFDNFYRVNVMRCGIVQESYFIEATEDGVISSSPKMPDFTKVVAK